MDDLFTGLVFLLLSISTYGLVLGLEKLKEQ